MDKKSTFGCCISLGLAMILWFNRVSSTTVEYMEMSLVCCEAIWICKMLLGLSGLEMESIAIHYNNQSCI